MKDTAFGFPSGTVRAILAISAFGVLSALAFITQDKIVMGAVISLATMAFQLYFGKKEVETKGETNGGKQATGSSG